MAELTQAQRDFIELARVARMATVGEDGMPHNVPVCPVLEGDRIYVATGLSRKVRNIRGNPQVALVFDEYMEDWDYLRMVLVQGRVVELIGPGDRFQHFRALFYEKFPQYPTKGSGVESEDTVIVEFEIDRVVSDGL